MKNRTLARMLDGAMAVKFDEKTECLLVWFGGHGVDVYSPTGEIITVSIGPYDRPLEADEVWEILHSWAENHEYIEYFPGGV